MDFAHHCIRPITQGSLQGRCVLEFDRGLRGHCPVRCDGRHCTNTRLCLLPHHAHTHHRAEHAKQPSVCTRSLLCSLVLLATRLPAVLSLHPAEHLHDAGNRPRSANRGCRKGISQTLGKVQQKRSRRLRPFPDESVYTMDGIDA